jgi:hypothetical protein
MRRNVANRLRQVQTKTGGTRLAVVEPMLLSPSPSDADEKGQACAEKKGRRGLRRGANRLVLHQECKQAESVSPSNPAPGQLVNFTSVVRNAGSATPSGVPISVGYFVDGHYRPGCGYDVPAARCPYSVKSRYNCPNWNSRTVRSGGRRLIGARVNADCQRHP